MVSNDLWSDSQHYLGMNYLQMAQNNRHYYAQENSNMTSMTNLGCNITEMDKTGHQASYQETSRFVGENATKDNSEYCTIQSDGHSMRQDNSQSTLRSGQNSHLDQKLRKTIQQQIEIGQNEGQPQSRHLETSHFGEGNQ